MPRAFDIMILYLSQDDKLSSCGLRMLQISTLANLETNVYELLLKLFDSSGDKHDEKISNCSSTTRQAGTSSRFCHESHDKTPNLMVFSEISFWNKMFLCSIKTGMFTVAESRFSSCLSTPRIGCCTTPSARDFTTVLHDTCRLYVLQMR